MQPDLPVRKPPGPLPGTGNGVIQLTIAPSSQGVRGAEWVVGENCKKPGREVKAGSGPSSPLTSVRLWAIIASTGRTFGPGVDPTVLSPAPFREAGGVEAGGVRPSVRREKVLVSSGCNSHPATGSLQPVAIGAAVEPFVPPSAAPSRPVNSGLGDLVLIANCLYYAIW